MPDDNGMFERARAVCSRAEFIDFIECLNTDPAQEPEEWENNSLNAFLAGLSGFTQDMSGYHSNIGECINIEVTSWRLMAQMLLAATVYGN